MFFKLVMPSVDRRMKGGVVCKWHKAVGDYVDYGDDLVDVKVEIAVNALGRSVEQKIRLVMNGNPVDQEGLANDMSHRTGVLVARVTSSDVGVLRRIETAEDAYAEVGGVLAVLSSEEHGPADPPDGDLREASEFRIVANLVE